MIYLDHATGTDLRPGVLEAMQRAGAVGGNPSSLHALGRRARRLVEDAADALRLLLGSARADIIFTSGQEEANALGLVGLATAQRPGRGPVALLADAPQLQGGRGLLEARGFTVQRAAPPPDTNDPPDAGGGFAVAGVVWAGVSSRAAVGQESPVAAWGRWSAAVGCPVHVDVSTAAGWWPVEFDALGMASAALCGHKLGGPRGIGALVLRRGQALASLWGGGGQHDGRRPGTEALPLICGFGEAARHCAACAPQNERIWQLREGLESSLRAVSPGAMQVVDTSFLPYPAVWLRLTTLSAAQAVQELGRRGVMAGLADERTVCLSLGWSSTPEDTAGALSAVHDLIGNGRDTQ